MTKGLLVSRESKIKLHKLAVSVPTEVNINNYKNFKTTYHRVLRAAKKLYFQGKLRENAANPKKTWETLHEILGN